MGAITDSKISSFFKPQAFIPAVLYTAENYF
jgi:hypothetical protein